MAEELSHPPQRANRRLRDVATRQPPSQNKVMSLVTESPPVVRTACLLGERRFYDQFSFPFEGSPRRVAKVSRVSDPIQFLEVSCLS